MLPFVLRRLGFDPASASAPFVATLVDVTGLIIYFTVALLLPARHAAVTRCDAPRRRRWWRSTRVLLRVGSSASLTRRAGRARGASLTTLLALAVPARRALAPAPSPAAATRTRARRRGAGASSRSAAGAGARGRAHALARCGYITAATLAFLFYTYPAWIALFAAAARHGARRRAARGVAGALVRRHRADGRRAARGVARAARRAARARRGALYALYVPFIHRLRGAHVARGRVGVRDGGGGGRLR